MTATEDVFTPIHKALRSMIYGLSARLQTNDFGDLATTRQLVTELENDFAIARSAGCALCILARHAEDEEAAIFPAAAKAEDALVRSLIEDHHDLTRRELALGSSAHSLLALESAADRIAAGAALNRSANELFAAYMTHMNREEAELVPRMQERFTDAEMAAMRGAIVSATPPDRLFAILGWMLPSLNVTELAGVLAAMQKAAPPAVMGRITALCSEKVDAARWAEVRARTGL